MSGADHATTILAATAVLEKAIALATEALQQGNFGVAGGIPS